MHQISGRVTGHWAFTWWSTWWQKFQLDEILFLLLLHCLFLFVQGHKATGKKVFYNVLFRVLLKVLCWEGFDECLVKALSMDGDTRVQWYSVTITLTFQHEKCPWTVSISHGLLNVWLYCTHLNFLKWYNNSEFGAFFR